MKSTVIISGCVAVLAALAVSSNRSLDQSKAEAAHENQTVLGLVERVKNLESYPPVGTLVAFAGPPQQFPNQGNRWMPCDGRFLKKSDYATLYQVIGDIYSVNAPAGEFQLPNTHGRVLFGTGHAPPLSNRQLGERIGNESEQIGVANLPAHTHELRVDDGKGKFPVFARAGGNQGGYLSMPNAQLPNALGTGSVPWEVTSTGGNQPIPVIPPGLVITYMITVR